MRLDCVGPKISFTATQKSDDGHVRATEVGVGAGATVGGWNALKRFKRFGFTKGVGDIVDLSKEAASGIKQAANVSQKTKSLWDGMFSNAARYKKAIVEWGQSLKVAKILKPAFESKAFRAVSGAVGGVGALFVFVSGIGEMGHTFSKLTGSDN